MMTGMEKPDQVSLKTNEIGGSIKFLVRIANPFSTPTENWTGTNIQTTIIHSKQATSLVHIDWYHFHLRILDSDTGVPRSGCNIYNRIGINPQGPIVTTFPKSNSAINCDILDLARRTLDGVYRALPLHDTAKSKKNVGGNIIFEHYER